MTEVTRFREGYKPPCEKMASDMTIRDYYLGQVVAAMISVHGVRVREHGSGKRHCGQDAQAKS